MRRLAVLFLQPGHDCSPTRSPRRELPDIGNPAGAIITESDEYQIGRMIVQQLRDEGAIIDDPEVNEYLQALGSRTRRADPRWRPPFQFFAVRDNTINAFALPGGFIGVNSGLVLATRNESELASVLAHEIAHVTQRHIARTMRAQGKQSIAATAAILAAILIGAMAGGSGDAMQGAIAIAQGAAAQQQVNFTRANEYEADRVGIGFLAAAGFDPQAMPSFFETMGRRTGLAGSYMPEMIQTPSGHQQPHRRGPQPRAAVRAREGLGVAELRTDPRAAAGHHRAARDRSRRAVREGAGRNRARAREQLRRGARPDGGQQAAGGRQDPLPARRAAPEHDPAAHRARAGGAGCRPRPTTAWPPSTGPCTFFRATCPSPCATRRR